MTRTITVLDSGVRYQVTGDYCPGCGYSAARFVTHRVTMPGYEAIDARMAMSVGMARHLQAEALAACIEGDGVPAFAGSDTGRGEGGQTA